MPNLGGYLPGTYKDMMRYGAFMRGQRANLDGFDDPANLSSQHFHAPRFESRYAYAKYVGDTGVRNAKSFLRDVQSGGVISGAQDRIARDQLGGAASASRMVAKDQMAGMGADVEMPGAESYITSRMDAALAGETGEARNMAAMADIQARLSAGQQLDKMAMQEAGLMQNIANMSAQSAQFNQPKRRKNPWRSLGMNALGSIVGLVSSYAGGGILGGLTKGITAGEGAAAAVGWDNIAERQAASGTPPLTTSAVPASTTQPVGPSTSYGMAESPGFVYGQGASVPQTPSPSSGDPMGMGMQYSLRGQSVDTAAPPNPYQNWPNNRWFTESQWYR